MKKYLLITLAYSTVCFTQQKDVTKLNTAITKVVTIPKKKKIPLKQL